MLITPTRAYHNPPGLEADHGYCYTTGFYSPVSITLFSDVLGCPRMSSAVRRRSMRIAEPDLDGLLGRFADAITLIRVSHRSLDALEVAFEEGFVLRRGLAALDVVYNELDLAIVAIHTRTPRITGDKRHPPTIRRGRSLG